MAIPQAVLAAGWIPFTVALVVVMVFAILYIRLHQHRSDKNWFSSIACILGLAVALLTSALVPVDIFLVSFMKDKNGHYKEWANTIEERQDITDTILYAYYAFYCLVSLFIFFVLPMAYFFYEEGGDDHSALSRCCTSIKYSLVFILAAGVMFLVGALVNFRDGPDNYPNSTEWDRIENLFGDLKNQARWENSISFTISALTMFGWLDMIMYTGYGMSAWPLNLMMGKRNLHSELAETTQRRVRIEAQIETIRNRRGGIRARDRRRIEELEDQLEILSRDFSDLQAAQTSCYQKCSKAFRPLAIVTGILFLCLAILIFVSLLITNIDKLIHSLGISNGYILPSTRLPNPIDITLVYAQQVFPLDYILVSGIVLYLFLCSVQALKYIGIWLCCVKLYSIRWKRTRPQGLLLMCWILMFIVLAINILLLQIAPQYVMYGNQHYVDSEDKLIRCSIKAKPSECTLSRMSMLVTRFCYKFWFFGAAYFWASWVLLLVFLVGIIVGIACKRRSNVARHEEEDIYDDSDEELLRP